ncbi:hypothetical protein KW805_01670 [Candidatus Pacearchaeota archaeon]|nr:hypothetical protein [Candidatus Pacearchaeota archaeon]
MSGVKTDIAQEPQTLHDKLTKDNYVIYGIATEGELPLMLSHLALDLQRKICSKLVITSLAEVVKGGKHERFSVGSGLPSFDNHVAYVIPADGYRNTSRIGYQIFNIENGNSFILRGDGLLGSYHEKSEPSSARDVEF